MWHEGTGKIIYDPHRGEMKRRTNWWAVVNVDREITRYYRDWVKRTRWVNLCQPSWDAHISIIRGEKPKPHLMHLWKKYHGEQITFKYKHDVYNAGEYNSDPTRVKNYWMIDIDCPVLLDIRKELELPTHWNLHLTVGRTYAYDD